MKILLGVALLIIGIAAGVYFGLWWAFIGGIAAIIEQIRAPHIDEMQLALEIVRVLFAAAIGKVVSLVFIVPAQILLRSCR